MQVSKDFKDLPLYFNFTLHNVLNDDLNSSACSVDEIQSCRVRFKAVRKLLLTYPSLKLIAASLGSKKLNIKTNYLFVQKYFALLAGSFFELFFFGLLTIIFFCSSSSSSGWRAQAHDSDAPI